MIVVADSGSTKCDWIFKSDAETKRVSTMGFNPMFHSTEFIVQELQKHEAFKNVTGVSHVYFYGAGCSSDRLKKIVVDALVQIFGSAEILVQHDLTGAVYAACQGQPGIACILGTGSNSAVFDGDKIHEEVPALGYILGDEGSGSYFGKQLLSRYLYKQLPDHIRQKFEEYYPNLDKDKVFSKTYMEPNANVYLASYMKFLSDNRDDKYIQEMVYHGLSSFIDIHIWQYKGYKNLPVHFVGSIAYFFEEVLRKAANNHRLQVGRIIRRPVDYLLEYHS